MRDTLRVPQRYIEILRAESGQKLGRAHRSMAVLASRASLSCQQQAPVVEGHGGVGRRGALVVQMKVGSPFVGNSVEYNLLFCRAS